MSLLSHLAAYLVNCGARDKRIVSYKFPRVTFVAAVRDERMQKRR